MCQRISKCLDIILDVVKASYVVTYVDAFSLGMELFPKRYKRSSVSFCHFCRKLL